MLLLLPQRYVFSSKSQQVYKLGDKVVCCCCYHKGTYFQANHNLCLILISLLLVVVATTKVRIFKQITTDPANCRIMEMLLLLPQRYVFSSKSQRMDTYVFNLIGCCCYHKGTYFQANHNSLLLMVIRMLVVVATTKVRIFKQITTAYIFLLLLPKLLLLPQRYVFSSKSQRRTLDIGVCPSCCCYHKGTYFQANHN